MANLGNFNAEEVEPNSGFEPIPAGKYIGMIVESEMVPTKAGNGQFLKLTFEITEGEFKGRKLWDRLNLENPKQEAVDIARRTLSAICHAVNVLRPQDSAELHNLPMLLTVKLEKNKLTDDLVNRISGYASKTSYRPGPGNGAAPRPQDNKAPWAR